MVQEIAKKLIRMGKKEEAQDLYFIPRREEYQVFMRVGDERRFVQSFPFVYYKKRHFLTTHLLQVRSRHECGRKKAEPARIV